MKAVIKKIMARVKCFFTGHVLPWNLDENKSYFINYKSTCERCNKVYRTKEQVENEEKEGF